MLVDEEAAPVAAATAVASSLSAAAAAAAGAVVKAGSAPIELQPAPSLLRWLEPTEVAVHTPPLLTLPLLTLLLNRTPDVFFDSRRRKIGLRLSSSREAAAGAGTASGGAASGGAARVAPARSSSDAYGRRFSGVGSVHGSDSVGSAACAELGSGLGLGLGLGLDLPLPPAPSTTH